MGDEVRLDDVDQAEDAVTRFDRRIRMLCPLYASLAILAVVAFPGSWLVLGGYVGVCAFAAIVFTR